jgi:hypothetical protein
MMNDIKNLTGGRLDAKAAHIAAEQMRASAAPDTYTARGDASDARPDGYRMTEGCAGNGITVEVHEADDDEPETIDDNETVTLDDTEKRRAAYTRLADGFIAMMNVRAILVEGCEIENGLEQRTTLDDALLAHFDALVIHADFFDPRTIAKFYVALRMHGDALRADRTGDGNTMISAVIDRNE